MNRDSRNLLVAGFATLLLSAVMAVSSILVSPLVAILVSANGLLLALSGLVVAFAPVFVKREVRGFLPLGFGILADAMAVVGLAPRFVGYAMSAAAFGLLLHLAIRGKRWRGVDVFAVDQPYRRGDFVAAAHFAVGAAGLLLSAVLFAWQPRGLLIAPLVALLLAFALPTLGGLLCFLLPRRSKRPLAGATLLGFGLFLGALSAGWLVGAFVSAGALDFRFPATGVLVAFLLPVVAFARLGANAGNLARASAALAALSGLALWFALAGGGPNVLLPAASVVVLAFAWVLAALVVHVGAKLLFVETNPRGTVASAFGIGGVLLLVSSVQYGHSTLPAAIALAIGAASLVVGLKPWAWPVRA